MRSSTQPQKCAIYCLCTIYCLLCVVCVLYIVYVLYLVYVLHSYILVFQKHLHTVIVICTFCVESPKFALFYKASSLSPSFRDTPVSSLQAGGLFSRGKHSDIHAGSCSECISLWITCNATRYAMQPGLQPDKLRVSAKLCKAKAVFSSP